MLCPAQTGAMGQIRTLKPAPQSRRGAAGTIKSRFRWRLRA